MFNFQIVKQHITHINDDIQEHAPPKASTASQALEKSNLKNRTKNKVSFGLYLCHFFYTSCKLKNTQLQASSVSMKYLTDLYTELITVWFKILIQQLFGMFCSHVHTSSKPSAIP